MIFMPAMFPKGHCAKGRGLFAGRRAGAVSLSGTSAVAGAKPTSVRLLPFHPLEDHPLAFGMRKARSRSLLWLLAGGPACAALANFDGYAGRAEESETRDFSVKAGPTQYSKESDYSDNANITAET